MADTLRKAQTIGDLVPTQAEVEAARKGQWLHKGQSRLQASTAAAPLAVVDDQTFKRTVRTRDQMHCRKCLRKVAVLVSRVAYRAEVHHVYGRRGDFRFDDRFAILVCCVCHEQLTGRVNERWRIVPTPASVFILVDGRELIDCRGSIGFERVA